MRAKAGAVVILSSILIIFCVCAIIFIANAEGGGDDDKKTTATSETTETESTEKSTDSTETPEPNPDTGGREVYFYYFDKVKPGPKNFGHDAWADACEAVKAKQVKDPIEYVAGKNGNLWTRINKDPALCAALGDYIDSEGASGSDKILAPEQNISEPLDAIKAARDRYLANDADWTASEQRIRAILTDPTTKVEIREVPDYTSAEYMDDDPDDPTKAVVIVRPTIHAGGHCIVFTVTVDGKEIELKLRLECGYQAIEPKIPVPPGPPEDDGKDINKSPGHREGAENFDFYSDGMKNEDNLNKVTSEPKSPEKEYKAPDPPKEKEVVVQQPTTEPDVSNGTNTGSKRIDEDNGKTVTRGDDTVKVVAGDGTNHGHMVEEVPKDVLQELREDGRNEGMPSAVE